MLGIPALLGSVFTFLGSIAPAVAQVWTSKTDSYTTQFTALTQTEREEYSASQQAQTATNTAKAVHGSIWSAQILTFMFGIGPAVHFLVTYLTATFPALGWHTDPMLGVYGEAEVTIAKSFFILTPTLPIVQAISARYLR